MFLRFQTTMTKFGLTIHLPAEGLDEGSDVEFFSLEDSTRKNFFFAHYTSYEHLMNINVGVFLRCL